MQHNLMERLDRLQLRRFRRAHSRVSGHTSSTSGYAGMLEELAWALRELDENTLMNIDQEVLGEVFGGPAAVAALAFIARRAPRATARLLARLAPLALHYLVGELERGADSTTNTLAKCRFRIEGGEELCRDVCQRPTELFCQRAGFPIVLEPSPDSYACEWRWGEQRT